MPLTRQERLVLEEAIKRIARLEDRASSLEQNVRTLTEFTTASEAAGNILDFTEDEPINFLGNAIRRLTSKIKVIPHNHKNDLTGGPCFAKLGANLISEDTEEEEII